MSQQQVPSLSEIRTEYELYEYLRDGSELCRMIGVVTEKRILDGIVYRVNNIATLEEKNISLFLNVVEQKLGLPRVFGGHGSKVLQKFATFYVALLGLSRVSEKIEKMYKIPKFHCSRRKTAVYFEDNNYKANEIQGYREADYEQSLDILGIKMSPTSLDQAIEVMISCNARFLTKILEPLKHCEERNTNDLLKREFFQAFQLEKLIELHENIRYQFEKLEYSYIEIGKIFEEVKDDILIYSNIGAQMMIAMGFFADQMSENEDAIKAVKELEKREDISIKELAQSIPHYAMKFPPVLESVRFWAYQERRTHVEPEARKAHQLIVDIVDQTKRVSADFQYSAAMQKYVEEIHGIDEFSQFGVLVKEVNDVEFSLGSHGDNFKNVDLLITDECVIVLDLKVKVLYKRGIFGNVKRVLLPDQKERIFAHCFQIKYFDQIVCRKKDETNLRFLWVKRIKDLRIDETNSFALKMSKDLAFEIEPELRKYHERNTAPVQEGSNHEGHLYRRYRGRGDLAECGLRCGECQQLMQGLLFFGINCKTCKEIFHEECFSADKSESLSEDEDGDDEKIEDAIYYIIQKRFDLVLEDFFVPGVDETRAEELLSKRQFGAFLMISTGTAKWLIVKEQDRLGSYEIKKIKVHGGTLYFLEKGTSAPNVVDLISKHRRTHLLLTPIRLNDNDETEQDDKEVVSVEEVKEYQSEHVETHSSYFWGHITAKEAEDLLKESPPGSFLLRKKDDEFRLSWKSFGLKLHHAVIQNVHGGFRGIPGLRANVTFKSLDMLVAYYQAFDSSVNVALGSPLLKEADQDEGKDLQRDQDSTRVPGFQGNLSDKGAKEMLVGKPHGTYLVQKNSKGNYTVTYKHNHRVLHLKLVMEGNDYLVKLPDNETVSATSLGRVIDKLRLKGLFSMPLQDLDLSSSNHNDKNEDQILRSRYKRSQSTIFIGGNYRSEVERREVFSTVRPKTVPAKKSKCAELQNEEKPDKDDDDGDQKEFKFFHNIKKTEARGMLFDKPEGTWILYYTKDTQEMIAFKAADNEVKYMKLISTPSGFVLNQDDDPVELEELIFKLQGEGFLKKQLTDYEESGDEEDC